MNKLLSVVAILFLFLTASCQKSEMNDLAVTDTLTAVKQASIASVSGPLSASVNQEVSFTVSWPYTGDCEKFKTFKIATLSDTTKIQLFTANNPSEVCAGKEVQRSSVYIFKAKKAGTYFLKFLGPGEKQGIIDTLNVK